MKARSTQSWFRQLSLQFGMGAALGTFVALYIIVSDMRLFQTITNSSDPKPAILLVVGVFALSFAVGSTLTGWIFLMEDETG